MAYWLTSVKKIPPRIQRHNCNGKPCCLLLVNHPLGPQGEQPVPSKLLARDQGGNKEPSGSKPYMENHWSPQRSVFSPGPIPPCPEIRHQAMPTNSWQLALDTWLGQEPVLV